MVTKTLLSRLLRSSSSLLGLMVIALASGGLLVQQREYQQDVAAHDFLNQASQTTGNRIAKQLDQNLEQLGLGRTDGQESSPANGSASSLASSPSDRSTHSAAHSAAAHNAAAHNASNSAAHSSQLSESSIQFHEIESSLNQYLKKQRHAEGQQPSPAPLPAAVAQYLAQQPSLLQIQKLILDEPLPTWELQVTQLVQNPQQTISFFPIAKLQRLLLAQGLHQYPQNPQATAESFEAAWQLTEAIAARPDLLSQMLSGILQQQQLTLLRHIELPGEQWQARLGRDQQQAILQALTFDHWTEYQTLQYQARHNQVQTSGFSWSNLIGKPYLQFSRLDWLAARKRNQAELMHQPFCDISTATAAFPVRPHRLNSFGQGGMTVFAHEWIKASDRMLAAELTQKIIQVKQLARRDGAWPQQLAQLNSQVCPERAWNYEHKADGSIGLWFDQPPHWRVGMAGDFAPLSYEAGAFRMDQSVGHGSPNKEG